MSSEWRRRVAAFACGLLLLLGWSAAEAAGHKPAGKSKKPVAARAAKKPGRVAVPVAPEPDVGAADIVDTDILGLRGHASFYGYGFQGRKTATGELFDVRQFTGASNRFPLGTMVAVRRLDNARCAIVKINDRMHVKHRKRIIDVSRGVAEYLNMVRSGVVLVRVAALKADWQGQGDSACHAAFEPDLPCVDCAQPSPWPAL